MKKLTIVAVGALIVCGLLVSTIALAGVENNNKNGWQVNGAHYNLNIIGKDRHADVGDSDGHTMFVKEDGKTQIYMTQGDEFKVLDRNGLKGSAEFQIAPGYYNVYAIARGKPNGKVNISATGNFTDAESGYQLLSLGFVDLSREKKKPQSENINELFYVDVTLCIAVNETTGACEEWVVYEDYWVFGIEELLEYYWDYDNDGLKLLQVRFYECQLINPDDYDNDPELYPKDYCRWDDGLPIIPSNYTTDVNPN
jgi:hypothetical protein